MRKGRKVLPLVLAAVLARGASASDQFVGAPDANGNRQGRPAAALSAVPRDSEATRTTATGPRRVVPGSVFSPVAVTGTASMVYPAPGDPDVNFWQAFAWTEVEGAVSYQLQVGTAAGLADVYDSGETPRTSLTLPLLPAGTYQARIATNVAGRWTHRDFTFGSSGYPAATLGSPSSGSTVASGDVELSWDPVPNADAYRLIVGTAYGESNVADSATISSTSYVARAVPQGAFLFIRLFTLKWGAWRATDAVLSTGPSLLPTLVYPVNGAANLTTGAPFEWKPGPYVTTYRLQIGTSLGGNDLHDSGEISVPKRFVGPLPVGRTLYGRLSARVNGAWAPIDFHFSVAINGSPNPFVVPAALWATDYVRGMANNANIPYPNTPLADLLDAEGWSAAFCGDYAVVLVSILGQINITQPARLLNVCLKPNSYDGHTLVEFQEPIGRTWMLLDPTFDLTARRASDGGWATASDISKATRSMTFSDVTYQFLGARGNSVATSYYLDYPLLYLIVCPQSGCPLTGPTSVPYMDPVGMPITGPGLYAIQGPPGDYVAVSVNGSEVRLPCDANDGLTYVFYAQSVDSLPGYSVSAFKPHRFVF